MIFVQDANILGFTNLFLPSTILGAGALAAIVILFLIEKPIRRTPDGKKPRKLALSHTQVPE